jgi:hypothetical protein
MAPGARVSDKPPSSPPAVKGGVKGGKGAKSLIPEPEPPKDPNAPCPEQICGCPNTLVNAYAQNLMKLHLEDEPEPVARRKQSLRPMAMAAIEAVSS